MMINKIVFAVAIGFITNILWEKYRDVTGTNKLLSDKTMVEEEFAKTINDYVDSNSQALRY